VNWEKNSKQKQQHWENKSTFSRLKCC